MKGFYFGLFNGNDKKVIGKSLVLIWFGGHLNPFKFDFGNKRRRRINMEKNMKLSLYRGNANFCKLMQTIAN